MDTKEYNKLYKEIMHRIAVNVKSQLNEMHTAQSKDFITLIEDTIDNYVINLGKEAIKIIRSLSSEKLRKFENADLYESAWIYSYARYGKTSLSLVESKHIITPIEAEKVANDLKTIFKLDDFQVVVNDMFDLKLPNIIASAERYSHKDISVIIAKNQRNLKEIKNFMRTKGYALIRKHVPYETDFKQIYILFFTPIERIDVSSEFIESNKFLYHLSKAENKDSILAYGLIPKERNGLDNPEDEIEYPERVYMFTNESSVINSKSQWESFGERCNIYRFKSEDIAKYYEMFYDPLFGKDAIYVERTVLPEYIDKID